MSDLVSPVVEPTPPTPPLAPADQAVLRLALVGNPNTGKTTLFNALTGLRQRVGNFAGVTVERVEGFFRTASGRRVSCLDLPGSYSLSASSPDGRPGARTSPSSLDTIPTRQPPNRSLSTAPMRPWSA